MSTCINCKNEIKNNNKYCSNKCQNEYQNGKKITAWLAGENDGMRGKTATARWIKQYLIDLRGEKCENCNWCERNIFTNNIPIELEHIDGDFKNNNIDNLKLLCPSCHSLTETYKGANKIGRPRSQYSSRKK